MALGETLGLYFEIAADPSKGIKAVEDFTASVENRLGAARGSFGLIAGDIERKWGLAEGSIARTGVAAQAAAKDLAYLAAGAGALAAGALALANNWAQAGTEIFEAAEKTGISAEKLSGLRATAKVLDENFGALTITLGRMGRNIESGLRNPAGDAGKVLQSLYKNTTELRELGLKPLDDRIAAVNQRIFALNNVAQQNLALTALSGRGYNEVRSTLQELALRGYDPLIERAKQLGQYFDEQSAARARQFRIELQTMKAEVSGLGLAIGRDLVPALSQWVMLTDVKLQQSLGKNLKQALRDTFAGAVDLQLQILTLGGGFGLVSDKIDALTLGLAGGKEETQAMTDRLVSLNAMVQANIKGTGELGEVHKKKAADEASEVGTIAALFSRLQAELETTDSSYKRYLTTLTDINKLEDEHSRLVLADINEQILRRDLAERQTKLLQDQSTWRTKETLDIRAETIAVRGMNAAWEESVAQQTGISGAHLRILAQIGEQKKALDELREKFRLTYVVGLRTDLQMSAIEIIQWSGRFQIEVANSVVALQALKDVGGAALHAFGQGMAQNVAQAIVYGRSVGEAMRLALKATLASIAAESMVQAIYATALGFLRLAQHQYKAAGEAFTAAAIFGTIGAVAAVAGAAIPGAKESGAGAAGIATREYKPEGVKQPSAISGQPSARGTGEAASAPTQVTNVYMTVQGDYMALPQAQDQLARYLNEAVERRDVHLTATRALKPTYAAR